MMRGVRFKRDTCHAGLLSGKTEKNISPSRGYELNLPQDQRIFCLAFKQFICNWLFFFKSKQKRFVQLVSRFVIGSRKKNFSIFPQKTSFPKQGKATQNKAPHNNEYNNLIFVIAHSQQGQAWRAQRVRESW